MPLIDHLYELRSRLLRAGLAYALGVAVAYVLWQPIYDLLRQPYCQVAGSRQCTLYVYGILDQFHVQMRVAFIGGAVVSAPVWLYQLGAFITPALHRKEKRYAAGFLVAALVLFSAGAGVAYLSLSHALRLLLHVAGDNVTNLPSLRSYLSFVTLILMLFGLAFEFPVVVVFLNVTGVLSCERMRAWRRGMYFALFAASAVLTPTTDPFTFIGLGVPLCLLYEVCIVIARLRDRAGRRRDASAGLLLPADDEISPVDASAPL